MINVQRLTGMRPGEVVLMRASDIDMTSQPGVWVFFPNKGAIRLVRRIQDDSEPSEHDLETSSL
jgi:integrase